MKYPRRILFYGSQALLTGLFFLFSLAAYPASFFDPSGLNPNTLEPRYIVKFRDTTGMSSLQSSTLQRAQQTNLLRSRGALIRRMLANHNAVSISVDPAEVARLRTDPAVEYVEVDQPRKLLSQAVPWGVTAVQADGLTDSGSAGTRVCIIDSGYDINTPDLIGNNHSGTNVSGTGNWFVPGGSHGTHVAGTIAAINNSDGVVGILPNSVVGIHVVKVFNEDGWGYSSDLVDAVQVCTDAGANVINMSLGGNQSTNTERDALQAVTNQGVLLIAAAGNDGTTQHSYPASYASVVSVAAVDETLQHAEFSQATNQVELAGPGVAVLSTVGVEDGIQSFITIGATQLGDDRVVPHDRYVAVGNSFISQFITGQASGQLAACTVSGSGSYSCGNMNGRICLAERFGNERDGNFPEINAVLACIHAGATGAIVYSNTALPGLQNPFLVDENDDVNVPTVTVSRATGLQLLNLVGQQVTLATRAGTDYAYYNGTSMAAPHVTGVAALVWSHHQECSGADIRNALIATALDLDSSGRDNRTGYGLVQAEAAVDYLNQNGCEGSVPDPGGDGNELENGIPVAQLSAARGDVLQYTLQVPPGAQNLIIAISGGSGDADLYVRLGQEPTTSSYDCRPYRNGNSESCSFSNVQAGTYFINLVAYASFSGVSLLASYDEPADDTGGAASFENTGNFSIPDNSTTGVSSPINSTRGGPSGQVVVDVEIVHTYIGDLIVDLIHPDGTVVNLHNRAGGSSDNIVQSYSVDLGNRDSSGTWNLRVRDRARLDTGFIDRWQINFE